VGCAVRRADEGKLIEVVLHALLAKHGVGDHAAADVADHQAVGARQSEDMIGRFAAATAVHVLVHEGGVAGNILLQKGQHGTHAKISRSAGGAAVKEGDGFTPIKVGL